MIEELTELRARLQLLKRDVGKQTGARISKLELRGSAESCATNWFASLAPSLASFGINPDTVEEYSTWFRRLMKLSAPSNRKSSYLDVLTDILRRFRDDLILPLQERPAAKSLSALSTLLADLPSQEENEYLQEAVAAAGHGLFRAAAVLGWCAAIDRVHRTIEGIGFTKFNLASSRMASETKGRFKRFSQPQNVHSLSELREVFDSVVLWILEGMNLIDVNQHTRLTGCFDLRCQCAHPGDAPVTEYNLLSFFSDLDKIVFRNPSFALPSSQVA